MKKLIPASLLGLSGLVTVGLLSLQAPGVSADQQFAKREDDTPELVLVADDDDDDTNDQSRSRGTGISRSTGDGTRSNFSRVSRNRDLSRSDLTRDRTRDGAGAVKRDWSANRTNDRSRNDSRR